MPDEFHRATGAELGALVPEPYRRNPDGPMRVVAGVGWILEAQRHA